jgi:hypothetical protein
MGKQGFIGCALINKRSIDSVGIQYTAMKAALRLHVYLILSSILLP